MDLPINEIVKLTKISKSTAAKEIPSYYYNGEKHCNVEIVEDWLMNRYYSHRNDLEKSEDEGVSKYCLFRAINNGDVFYDVKAKNKNDFIEKVIEMGASKLPVNSEFLKNLLIEREGLSPTDIPGGIAIPHARNFFLDNFKDVVIVVLLKDPIDWNSVSNQLVNTIFFLFSNNSKNHIQLLSKIAQISQKFDNISSAFRGHSKNVLLKAIKMWEEEISF